MERADIGWRAGGWVDPGATVLAKVRQTPGRAVPGSLETLGPIPRFPRAAHASGARARHARFGDWPRTTAHSGGNLGGSMAKHGRYRIVRPVADGGMAEIFLATQMGRDGFQKPVILKRIHSSIYADPQ